MAISQTQAQNFVNRTKVDYLAILAHVQVLQAIATLNTQEVTAWGGASVITAAVPTQDWDNAYPFTKAEFADILSNLASVADVLGSHGDLKPNLTKLRE